MLDDRGLDRMTLVVHDWGSVGLLFAMRAPERIQRLVIIDRIGNDQGRLCHVMLDADHTSAASTSIQSVPR